MRPPGLLLRREDHCHAVLPLILVLGHAAWRQGSSHGAAPQARECCKGLCDRFMSFQRHAVPHRCGNVDTACISAHAVGSSRSSGPHDSPRYVISLPTMLRQPGKRRRPEDNLRAHSWFACHAICNDLAVVFQHMVWLWIRHFLIDSRVRSVGTVSDVRGSKA